MMVNFCLVHITVNSLYYWNPTKNSRDPYCLSGKSPKQLKSHCCALRFDQWLLANLTATHFIKEYINMTTPLVTKPKAWKIKRQWNVICIEKKTPLFQWAWFEIKLVRRWCSISTSRHPFHHYTTSGVSQLLVDPTSHPKPFDHPHQTLAQKVTYKKPTG